MYNFIVYNINILKFKTKNIYTFLMIKYITYFIIETYFCTFYSTNMLIKINKTFFLLLKDQLSLNQSLTKPIIF